MKRVLLSGFKCVRSMPKIVIWVNWSYKYIYSKKKKSHFGNPKFMPSCFKFNTHTCARRLAAIDEYSQAVKWDNPSSIRFWYNHSGMLKSAHFKFYAWTLENNKLRRIQHKYLLFTLDKRLWVLIMHFGTAFRHLTEELHWLAWWAK